MHVYGLHAVRALLAREPGRIRRLWLQSGRDDRRVAELRELAAAAGVVVATRPGAELDDLAEAGVHQGAVAEIEAAAARSEDDLTGLVAEAGTGALLLVLDGLQDPHNLGACLRSADAAGVTAVLAPRDRACGLTPVVRKVAAGAAESVPFIQVTNLARALRQLKQQGVWIAGLTADGEQDLFAADLTGPLALVLGAEGSGLRRLTQDLCDFRLRLPMRGAVESLNVSVAAGIVLYEALRQRSAAVAKPA